MDIRFVSSLTAEDENAFAPALLKAIGALLDQLPIAYTVRIETTGSQVFQHTHSGEAERPGFESADVAPPINSRTIHSLMSRANGTSRA